MEPVLLLCSVLLRIRKFVPLGEKTKQEKTKQEKTNKKNNKKKNLAPTLLVRSILTVLLWDGLQRSIAWLGQQSQLRAAASNNVDL